MHRPEAKSVTKATPAEKCAAEMLYEMPESGCPAKPALVHIDPENPDVIPQPPPLPPRPRARYNAVAVRLGSNHLASLDGLVAFLEHVLDDPKELVWLDLSCNALERIEDVLCTYPNLQVGSEKHGI